MFANNLFAKTTILDKTPIPTILHFSFASARLSLGPNWDELFVPHSSSIAHMTALPKPQAAVECGL